MDPAQDGILTLSSLTFRWIAMPGARLQSFDPSLSHGQVSHQELEIEPLDIPGRVDAAVGVRVARVLEGPDDMEQGVRVTQPGKMVGRQLLRADMTLGRWRQSGQIDVRDVGLDDLLRLEHTGQDVEARIGNLDDPDIEGDAAVAAGLGVATGEGVEDGGLARAGKPDDGDLHRAIVARISSRRSGRPG